MESAVTKPKQSAVGKRIIRSLAVVACSLLALPAFAPSALAVDQPETAAQPEASVARAGTDFVCEPGYVYTVSQTDGTIREIGPDGSITRVGSGAWAGGNLNSIAIDQGGAHAYAVERYSDSYNNANTVAARGYDAATGTFTTLGPAQSLPELTGGDSTTRGSIVAGAADLKTGTFMIGGFASELVGWRLYEVVFVIYEFVPAEAATGGFSKVGVIRTGERFRTEATKPARNGDMAFDSQGNLYFVRSGEKDLNIFSVSAAELENASGGDLRASATPVSQGALKNVNGIAFDSDGTVYLGDFERVERYDPITWQHLGTHATGLKTSSDLASCSSPSSLTLRKNIVSRAQASDQFTISMAEGAATIGSATTTGSGLGIRPEQVGPFPVRSGKTYAFSEAGAEGAELSAYTSEWTCTDASTGATLASGTGTSGEVSIPDPQPSSGASIVCDISNAARSTLTLTKAFDNSYGASDDPAVWDLHATPDGGDPISFASGETHVVGAGGFAIGEAPRPGYELRTVECSTDAGTVPVDAEHRIDIGGGEHVACVLTNADLPGSVSWSKVDEFTGDRLAGAQWLLTGPQGEIEVTDNTGQEGYAGRDTDERPGSFTVAELAHGDYELVETVAPEGYEITNRDPIAFTIAAEDLEVRLPSVPNRLLLEFGVKKFSLATASQAQPELLDGAAFEVRADDGGAPGAVIPGAVGDVEAGVFTLTGLTPGTYWLVETASPDGYAALVEPIEFTVTHDAAHPDGALALTDPDDPLVALAPDRKAIHVYDSRAVALPTAGGSGPGYWALGGAAIAALAGATWLMTRSMRHRARAGSGAATDLH